MNVSDQLVEMLKQAGVKRVYAITGDSLNPVNDAIRRDGTLEWIHVRHEESAAYAASMDAEINGIGCCMGSSGPGHVHLINGLYDANRSGNPVIAIASTCHTEKFGSDYFQETNPILLFNDCSKYNQIAASPKQFATMMPRAIQIAKEEKGVSVISLPGDVAEAPASDVPSSLKSYVTKSIFRPNDLEIKELAEIINNHKKIALYCGYGAKDAVKEVELLAEKLNATIAYSFRGKIFFDKPESQYTVGMNGLLGNPSGFKSLEKADVVLMLGTDFPYAEFMPKDNLIVQIDKRAEIIGRRAKVDYGYQGDIKDTLEVLLPFLNVKKDKDLANHLLKITELEELKNRMPQTLSGGQKQRVSLCRALMNRPKLLLMDEPLSALDPKMRTKLQNEILTLHKEFNTTTIMVSHDPSEIYRLANRIVVLNHGQIINDGTPKDILLKTKGSQKFSFEGELLDIIKVDVIHIAIVAIGQQLVEVVVSKEEVKNLKIGQKVSLSTKAFSPTIQGI